MKPLNEAVKVIPFGSELATRIKTILEKHVNKHENIN